MGTVSRNYMSLIVWHVCDVCSCVFSKCHAVASVSSYKPPRRRLTNGVFFSGNKEEMAEEELLRSEFGKLILSYPESSDLHEYCFDDFLALSERDLDDFKGRAAFKHRGAFARLHSEGA